MADFEQRKPILITGSHRSGSTWVGRMLALEPTIGYIHEPFAVHCRPGICRARFDKWFMYICSENEGRYRNDLAQTLSFRYRLLSELRVIRNPRDIIRMFRDIVVFSKNRIQRKRPLMKDPIALFSADWLARSFDMDVIVLIRHPAAFAGSLKKAQWYHPFSHFLRQPLLMAHHLAAFHPAISDHIDTSKDIIDHAILLWNLFHHMILKYRDNHPEWLFIRHEDLSRDPLNGFAEIYRHVGLQFADTIKARIESFSSIENPTEHRRLDDIKRDSKSNIKNWKKRLTAQEIQRVRNGTDQLSSRFYSADDWA